MKVKCIDANYSPSERIYYLTPGEAPGYITGHQLTDLVLQVLINDEVKDVSIGKEFKKMLKELHGKNKQLKRLEPEIKKTIPDFINVTINHANYIIVNDDDIKSWASRVKV